MLENQKGNCKICGKHYTETKAVRNQNKYTHLHVDHSHLTGEVRGLLCFNCNATLGHVNDTIFILQNAIKYLKEAEERKVRKENK